MNRLSSLLLVATLFIASVPAVSSAQVAAPTLPNEIFQVAPLVCSDFYVLGSMLAETTFLAESAVPGLPAEFQTVLTNTNAAPLVDVSVVAKVFMVDDSGDVRHTLAYTTVASGLTFASGESQTINFSWDVPRGAPAGMYQASFYVVSGNQYNWLGLPFSDDSRGSSASFAVVNDAVASPVLLDASSIIVNGTSYSTGMPITIPAGLPATASAVISNTSDEAVVVAVAWQQFPWSAEQSAEPLHRTSEIIELAPQSEKTVTFTTVPSSAAVYYVTATVESALLTTHLGARLVQEEVNQLRTAHLGVSQFPLVAGQPVTAVACVQNTSRATIDMAQVTLTLKDRNDEIIRTIDYFGSIDGALGGYGEAFTPDQNYNYLKVESTLARNGEVDETMTVIYDCEVINPESCLDGVTESEIVSAKPANLLLFVGGLFIILLLVVVFVYVFRRRGVSTSTKMPPPSNPSITLSILFVMMVFGVMPAVAAAQSCSVLQPGYESPSNPSDTILYVGLVQPNCQALCNTAMASQNGTRYCNLLSENSGMQWGFVVPDVGLSNGTWTYTCRLSQQPQTYSNPFVWPTRSWSGSTCTPPPPTNNPPAAPTVSGPTTGQITTGYNFTIQATDPDGNQIRYGIDVNNDNLIDAWLPSSGYTNSGTSLTYSRSWPTVGTHSFRVLAEDSNSARSSWTTHTITISTPPPPPQQPLPPSVQTQSTLTGTGCTIPVGGSTCNGSVTWNVLDWNTNGFYTITRTVTNQRLNQGFMTGLTSGTQAITLTQGNNLIVLWETVSPAIITLEMNNQYAETTLVGTCATGSSWNGSSCAATQPAGACTLGPETVGDSGPTDMWGGAACMNVNDLAPFMTPSCPSGATTGTVVSSSDVIAAGFCATRQVQSSQCFGTAYVRSCSGASLPPPATNQAPTAPTIVGPTSGTPTTNYQFSFTGTDPNGDQIRYGIDWDFNGVIDAWLPASQYVNSGTAQVGNRTWPSDGTYSFRALTQDAAGAVSGWTTHTITIANTAASCTWQLNSTTDDFAGASSNSNMTCPATTCSTLTPPVTAAMDGQAASPSAPNVCVLSCSTSGNYRYLDTMTKQGPGCAPVGASCSDAGIVLTATSNAEFAAAGASCQSLGYTQFVEAGQEDAQPGFFSNPPNGTCSVVFADSNGAIMYRYVIFSVAACIPTMTPAELPNLVPVLNQNNIVPSSAVNAPAGTYNSLTLTPILRNTGNGSTLVAVPYSLRLTNQTTNTQNNHAGQVGIIAGNGTAPASYAFSNVPFGRYEIRAEADPTPGIIVESNESDNVITQSYVLPPPNPNLDLGVSPGTVVRAGTVVTLNWTVNVSYDMTCSLVGPALTAAVSFNPRTDGVTGTVTAGPITATSDYVLTCVEPITNTTFTDTTRVETIGTVQEI